jgi:hypothetical protein
MDLVSVGCHAVLVHEGLVGIAALVDVGVVVITV